MKRIYLGLTLFSVLCVSGIAQNTSSLIQKSVENLQAGNVTSAISYAQKAKTQAAKEFGTQTADYISVEKHLADLYIHQGEYDKAIPLYVEASNTCAKVLGKKDDYVQLRYQLASLYKDSEQWDKAITTFKEVATLSKTLFKSKYPQYVQAINELAMSYHQKGDLATAKPLYEEARQIVKQLYGTDHPDYVTITDNLDRLNEDIAFEEKRTNPPPAAEPNVAWLKDFSQAPQIALMNEAYMKGKQPMIGASSFLVEYNGKVYGITAKHLIQENGGGYKPPIKASELNTVCASWSMYPRTVEKDFVKMGKLLNTEDEMQEDVLIFSINGTVPASVKPLKVRQSTSLPTDVWLIGCPYSEENCKQNLYHASVLAYEQGYIIAQNLQPQVNIQGFSGAPVVDENGEVVGSASFSAKDNLIIIPSLLPVLQNTVGN